jgi:hypothetical protein
MVQSIWKLTPWIGELLEHPEKGVHQAHHLGSEVNGRECVFRPILIADPAPRG